MDRVFPTLCLMGILGGLTLATYAGSLSGGYVYEDIQIAPSPIPPAPPRRLLETLVATRAIYPPRLLTELSYTATEGIVSPEPWAARSVSLAWHMVNGLLVWLLARRVVTAAAAFVAVGLFLLLPSQVEAVAAVAYRSELVMTTWILLACLCASRGWLIAAFVAAGLAVTGKEAGVVALLLVPLWARWQGVVWTRPALAVWVVGSTLAAVFVAGWFASRGYPLVRADLGEAIARVGYLVALIPLSVVRPDVLTIDHDWRGLTATVGGFVALGGIAWITWSGGWWRRAAIWLGVGLSLRVVLNMSELHEHHLYAAVIVPCLAIGASVFPAGAHACHPRSLHV